MLTNDELFDGFERATLESFHHADHVRTAWLYVRRHGMPAALTEFTTALKRFAIAKGAPNLYHETITWAYLLLIAERLRDTPTDSWTEFSAAHPELLTWKPSILDRYYSAELLWSDRAKTSFVMPDLTRSA